MARSIFVCFFCFELIIFGGLSGKKKPCGEGCLFIFKMARARFVCLFVCLTRLFWRVSHT